MYHTNTPETRQSQQQARLSSSLSILKVYRSGYGIKRTQATSTRYNGKCCFNHVVGLPQKDKQEYPMFDYEKILYDSLLIQKN